MFESKSGLLSPPEVIARFDEMFERHYPSKTPESSALVDRVRGWVRVENRAAAASLVAMGELFGYRLSRCSDTEDWAVDTEEAVIAEGRGAADEPRGGRQPVALCAGHARTATAGG